MTYTYDITNDIGKVRLRIGDVAETTNESVTDEEIQLALDDTTNLDAAALRCLEFLIARLRRLVTRSEPGVNSQQGEKLRQALELHKVLLRRVGKGGMNAYAGQVSTDRLDDARDDSDYEQPAFRVGQFENPPSDHDDDCGCC